MAPAVPPPYESPLDALYRALRGALALALALGAATLLASFATIALKLEVYALVIPTGSLPTALGLALGFVLVAALLMVFEHLRDLALLAAGRQLTHHLSEPVILAAAARAGEPAAASGAILADVDALKRAMAGPLCGALIDAALVPATLLLLWAVHPGFAGLALACCLLAGAASLAAQARTRDALADSNTLANRTAALVADAMRCAEAVAAMGMRPALEWRWSADLREAGRRMRAAQEWARRLSTSCAALQAMGAGGAMLLGAWLSLRGVDLGIGLMAAMLLTGRVVDPFARLGGAVEEWAGAQAAWRRLRTTLAQAPQAAPGTAFPCVEGRLVLDKVTYLHPGTPRPLLREVDLAVAPGEVVAIIGPPGAGKTTLLRLMLGLHRPTAGGAFFDGHATAQWARSDLARHIGYLPQDPVLGEGSVAEAIARLGLPDDAAVLRAAALCGADRMIAALPFGYATPVAGGGECGLSMGQRQRVALARAVYGAPRLVLLDEPTAWLDTEGEAAVIRLLRNLRAADCGVVLSSHRRAIVAAADRVFTLGEAGTLRPVAMAAPAGNVVPLAARPAA